MNIELASGSAAVIVVALQGADNQLPFVTITVSLHVEVRFIAWDSGL